MAWTTAAGVLVPVLAGTHAWINGQQAEPYMDELFHVPQAVEFCNSLRSGQLPLYLPHITTPPGLYVLSAIASWPTQCDVQTLRGIAALSVFAALLLLGGVAFELCGEAARSWRIALSLATHPPLLFCGALFYSDAPAVALLMLCWLMALRGQSCAAALAGIGAVSMRQTCAVWHAMFTLHSALRSLRIGAPLSSIVRQVLPNLTAFVLYAVLFVANGWSITIGDRSNHAMMLHGAQLAYFSAYRGVFALTVFLPVLPMSFGWYLRAPRTVLVLVALALCVVTACIAQSGSFVHPFAIADNRHYIFYLYRKVLLRGPLIRFALIPFYAAALVLPFVPPHAQNMAMGKTTVYKYPRLLLWLVKKISTDDAFESLVQLIALLAVAVTVIPSPLLEPRYFIPGFLVSMMIFLTRKTLRFQNSQYYAFCTINLAIHFLLVFVFAQHPFDRPPDPHMPHDLSPGRFML